MKNRFLIGENTYLTERTSVNMLERARLEANKEVSFDELQSNLSAYKELSVEEINSDPQSISNGISKITYYQSKDFYLIGKRSETDEWERLFHLILDEEGALYNIILPPQESSVLLKERVVNYEYEELLESHNRQHNAIYDYIDAHGADERLQTQIIGTYFWLKLIAKRNGFELEY